MLSLTILRTKYLPLPASLCAQDQASSIKQAGQNASAFSRRLDLGLQVELFIFAQWVAALETLRCYALERHLRFYLQAKIQTPAKSGWDVTLASMLVHSLHDHIELSQSILNAKVILPQSPRLS